MTSEQKQLRNYAEHYLICRDLGHAWIEDQITRQREGGIHAFVRVLGCGRCNMTRIDTFTHRGELVRRLYRQPNGYKLEFRPVAADVRQTRFKQGIELNEREVAFARTRRQAVSV